MQTLPSLAKFPPHLRHAVLCIGNFDGVHAGHARMLQTAADLAQKQSCPFVILTFDPHPAVILKPDSPRRPLTTLAQRTELLAAFGPTALIVEPTTREFLATPADDFLAQVVRDTLAARHLVEGPTFTFGRGKKGTIATLESRGPELGFAFTPVTTVERTLSDLTCVNVSSSLIRWLIERGRIADAALCLGRPYAFRGTVVVGQKRGQTIGFPTANVESPQLLPAAGIYAGAARLADAREFPAAISVGTNPTFAGQNTTVEAHLLDFAGDLYGQTVEIHFRRWIRDMLKFSGVPPLVRQMTYDVAQVRAFA